MVQRALDCVDRQQSPSSILLSDTATNTGEKVGTLQVVVRPGAATPDGRARWESRAELLASWLKTEWRRRQKETR